MQIIEVSNLHKVYKIPIHTNGIRGSIQHLICPLYTKKNAVNKISFNISKGESVAFIGANGAGKSTTLKMLTGIMKPTSGTIQINGIDPFSNRMHNAQNIGVIFGQKTQLWWDIPIINSFNLLKDIYAIPDQIYQKNLTFFTDVLGLNSFINEPPRKISLGQRVCADFAAALLHNPTILFLDEPTIGLDLAIKNKIYQFLNLANIEFGTTILLTSHDIKDIEKICKRCIIIDCGNIIFDDNINKISKLTNIKNTISLDYSQLVVPFEQLKQNYNIISVSNNKLVFLYDQGQEHLFDFLKELSKFIVFTKFEYHEPKLEQILIDIFER